jgi:lipopolysaccharide/colanic/teichoic acid biosynthesis glycosyltransferase
MRGGKRCFDLAVSLAGLAILSPLMVFCALLVRLTSRGPVFFRQTRVGYGGRPFVLIKFRTMVHGSEASAAAVEIDGDRRLTSVGAFLRRTKLDEMPQLVNVLRGEMSLVGPRPRVPSEVDLDDPQQRILLMARPGLTSPASIHHRREADFCARHPNPQAVHQLKLLPQKLSLDGEYVQNPTFWGDLKLMALTFLLVLSPGRPSAAECRSAGREPWPFGRTGQFVLDLLIYVGAAGLAYRLRYEAGFPEFYRQQMWLFMAFVPPVRVIINRWRGVYDLMWRYVNLVDAAFIAAALAPLSMVLLLLRLWLPVTSWGAILLHVPLSVATLEYLIALSASVGLRRLRQKLYVLQCHYQPLPEAMHHVLILGAGLLGLRAAIDMRRYPHMNLVGFLDDDPAKHRRLLAGCRVLGNSQSLETLWARHRVSDLVVCVKSIDSERIVALLRRCSGLGVKLHLLPSLDRLLQNEGNPFRPLGLPSALLSHRGPLKLVTAPLGHGDSARLRPDAPNYRVPHGSHTLAEPSSPFPPPANRPCKRSRDSGPSI